MVVFTCGHCGESIQKPKVEKHYLTKCRNKNPNLSCMDCFKDFLGNDYEAHIKCITEEERYSGKGFTPKEKKGEKKQNAWVEMLQSVLENHKDASRNVLRIIETISKHNNTPRKKPKFINFVKNVCGQKTNPKDIDQAWELISVKLTELSNLNAQNRNQNQKDKIDSNNSSDKKQNGDVTNSNTNGDVHDEEEKEEESPAPEKDDKKEAETQNGDVEESNKKLSKKQRKEEKKRKKYEAELLSAEAPAVEVSKEPVQLPKKGKKNKNKENINGHEEETNGHLEEKDKMKKRKRQETVSTSEVTEVVTADNFETQTNAKLKVSKKKLKMERELAAAAEANESICLHDQNVAKSENEVIENDGKFNWHAVIMSVLQKKGNEVPFKRLQKKVLSEYSEYTGNEVDDRIADKFIKKLKSAPNVRVDKNRVLLLEDDE